MKTTVEKILRASKAISEFNAVRVNSKLSFRLSRFQDKISGVVKTFNEANSKLIVEKYGDKIEGETFKVSQEKLPEYNKEIAEILAQEEEIDFTINLSLFEGEKVSKDFFNAMGDFIIED